MYTMVYIGPLAHAAPASISQGPAGPSLLCPHFLDKESWPLLDEESCDFLDTMSRDFLDTPSQLTADNGQHGNISLPPNKNHRV